jgi:hypothetical protein
VRTCEDDASEGEAHAENDGDFPYWVLDRSIIGKEGSWERRRTVFG